VRRLWLVSVGSAAVLGVLVGVLEHGAFRGGTSSAAPGLPALFGEATWGAGERPAPEFSLRDRSGRLFSLSSLRGSIVALTFMDSRCREACPVEGKLLGAALRKLAPGSRPRLVIVSVNPSGDTPSSVVRALRKWTLPSDAIWLFGTHAQLANVWRKYEITVDPVSGDIVHSTAVYLLDRRGGERAGVLMPFPPSAVARDLRALAGTTS
jgi:protein SCO1/2